MISYLAITFIGVARILDWGGGGQTKNDIGEKQKKRVFTATHTRIFAYQQTTLRKYVHPNLRIRVF